jgi:hypothetical protein
LPSKHRLAAIALCLLAVTLPAEVLQTGKLKRPRASAVVHRDPFLLFVRSQPVPLPTPVQQEAEQKVEDLAQRLIESIDYTGYIGMDGEKTAFLLLNASGETVSVKAGDVVHNELKIITIEERQVVVEYNQKRFIIPKKGVPNG